MKKPNPQYLIIGSDNFWYASCLENMEEVKQQIEHIKKNISSYCDAESGEPRTELPKKFYIYKASEIEQIYN